MVNIKKKDLRVLSQVMIGGAIVSVVLSGIGFLGTDIWLASTQWLIVASVLALFGVYLRIDS